MPLVQEHLSLLKNYEGPQKAASGMTKQMGKVPKEPKDKAKGKAKASWIIRFGEGRQEWVNGTCVIGTLNTTNISM